MKLGLYLKQDLICPVCSNSLNSHCHYNVGLKGVDREFSLLLVKEILFKGRVCITFRGKYNKVLSRETYVPGSTTNV